MLNSGANPNHTVEGNVGDWWSWTPLALAVHNYRKYSSQHEEVVKLLLMFGAEVNYYLMDSNWAGWSPICMAISNSRKNPKEKQLQIVNLLIQYGANTQHKVKDTITPLQLAHDKGYTEIEKALENAKTIDKFDLEEFINNFLTLDEKEKKSIHAKKSTGAIDIARRFFAK